MEIDLLSLIRRLYTYHIVQSSLEAEYANLSVFNALPNTSGGMMKSLYARKRFCYHTEPKEIKMYLAELGYQTEELYNRAGDHAIGFAICNTTITVGYPSTIENPGSGEFMSSGQPMISMRNSPITTGGNEEKAERSLVLYQKLYRRFRKRPQQ